MSKTTNKRRMPKQPEAEPSVNSDTDLAQRRVRIVSLFSGAGGLEIAACQTGNVQAIVSTDSNATFLSTVEKNMPTHFPEVRHSAIVADARELKGTTLKKLLGCTPDIVMGGPPCDDFTTLGRRRGVGGEKGPLIFEFLRIVDELRPPVFMFENVPNLARQFKHGFSQFLKNAAEIGYSTQWAILKACDFGAPTLRKRIFAVGWDSSQTAEEYIFPQATHGEQPQHAEQQSQSEVFIHPYIHTCDVLGDLPDVGDHLNLLYPNHIGRKHRAETIEQFKEIIPGKSSGKSYRYRAPWKGFTQSLTAGIDTNTKAYIHPHFHREMTVREYARLQVFPDTWAFMGTNSNGLKQVANSVPIPLGKAVLATILERLHSQATNCPA